MYQLLLIDDDIEVLHIHNKYFTSKGFGVSIAQNAEIGLKYLSKQQYDCILLDVMMPGLDGFAACERIRAETGTPILFLTGRLDEQSKIRGLMTGADDYIAKPCSLAELEARIMANIRRHTKSTESSSQAMKLSFPPLEIDIVEHQAYCNGESLQLTSREYEILYLMAIHENNLVTYEQLAKQMWGSFQEDDRRSVMVGVSRLRKKMGDYAALKDMIETVWSKGYKFSRRGQP